MSLKHTVRTRTRDLRTGMNEFQKGYKSRTTLVKDENDDLLANPTTF